MDEGHNHSDTLDKITESIRKLRQTQQAIIAEKQADSQWTPIEGATTPASSSTAPTLSTVLATPMQEDQPPAPQATGQKDRQDSGRVKRVAVAKEGEQAPQQQTSQS